MSVILRDTTQTIANYHFNTVSISSGPDQVNDKSWTPSFWVTPPQNYGNSGIQLTMDRTFVNRRGLAWGGGHNGDAGVSGVFGFREQLVLPAGRNHSLLHLHELHGVWSAHV